MSWKTILHANVDKPKNAVECLQFLCGGLADEAGWNNQPLDVPRSLMLIVSELGEAMEGHRKNLRDTHLPKYDMLRVELADAVIRIMHLADRLERKDLATSSFGEVLVQKLIYNTQREDHKPEVRAQKGGKAY